MAFPSDPADLLVELDLDGSWTSPTDISAYVYTRDAIEVTRGKSAEGSTVDPSTMGLTLNSTDGRFASRNPTGPYYGTLGRNTRVRASVLAGTVRGTSTSATTGYFIAADSAALSITGDIDIRVDLRPYSGWRFRSGSSALNLANKWGSIGNRSWWLELEPDGTLRVFWVDSGGSSHQVDSTAPVPYPVTGRRAVRFTLDVDNGASGNTVTFYTADTLAGTWVQLGDAVVTASTTSIFDSTAEVHVDAYSRDLYAFEMRSVIGGTVKADPDFAAQTEGDTSFSDGQGNTWTLSGSAKLTARRFRFYGEIASWPQKWDPSGADVWVPVSAAGVLRRLGAAGAGLRSTMYRGVTLNTDDVVAYWPMEDAASAVSLASAVDGVRAMKVNGTPDLASYSDFKASAPVPVIQSAQLTGYLTPYDSSAGMVQVRLLLAVPAAGDTSGARIARIYTTGGTVAHVDLVYQGGGGDLSIGLYDASGTQVDTSGVVNYNVDGKRVQVSVELTQNGADIDWRFSTIEEGTTTAGYTAATLAGYTFGRVTAVTLNADTSSSFVDTAFGHLYVQSTVTDVHDLEDQLAGWDGETAGDRIARLCDEEGVSVIVVGDSSDTEAMGPQSSATTLVEMLSEAAETDQGLLFETRHQLGLGYRTRVSLHNQGSALDLDYAAAELSNLEPVDDDQEIHNDVTVSRTSGSSYRATLTTGALSSADPPDGVGRYEMSASANPQTDPQLKHEAGWRLHLGTADEARYPSILVDLAREAFTSDLAATDDVLDLDVGDRVAVTNLPAWLPPDDISQLVRGTREQLGAYVHTVEVVGTAERPWRVGIYDDPAELSRYHSDGSTLAEDLTTTETGVDVATASGPLWTTDGAEMPFDIVVAGERMTVTAVSGTTSPQTFTVTRSVNGVVKAQSTGATVDLADPTYYAI